MFYHDRRQVLGEVFSPVNNSRDIGAKTGIKGLVYLQCKTLLIEIYA